MKEFIKKIILIAFIGVTITSNASVVENGKTIIRGETTVASGMVNLYYGVKGYNTRATSRFSENRFMIEAEIEKPEFLIFWTTDPLLNQFNLYLKPGDDLSIKVKNNKIVLTGKGSVFNQFYVDLSLQHPYNTPKEHNKEAYSNRIKAINACNIPEVINNKNILIGQTQGEYLDAIFGEYIRAKIVPPEIPLPRVEDIGLDIQLVPELSNYYNWSGLLNELLFVKIAANKLKLHHPNSWVADFANSISSKPLKEAYIVDIINTIYDSKDLVTIHDLAKEALPLVKDKANRQKIQSILQKAKEDSLFRNASPGADFSTVNFKKADGNSVTIADYNGKIIFIDIWATWCAPCIAKMPFLKQIEHDMAGDDIVFLSVCGNTEARHWLDYLNKHNPTGEQLWMPGGTNGSFFKQIGPSGIPRFVILDKNGKMLNPKSYLRPSDPTLRIYLKELTKS